MIFMVLPGADYAGSLLFFYENGKVARIEMKAYQTAPTAGSSPAPIPTSRPWPASAVWMRTVSWLCIPTSPAV